MHGNAIADRQTEEINEPGCYEVIGDRSVHLQYLGEGSQESCRAHFPLSKESGKRNHCTAAATVKISIPAGRKQVKTFACDSVRCQEKVVRLAAFMVPTISED